jgi:hypothetical protein
MVFQELEAERRKPPGGFGDVVEKPGGFRRSAVNSGCLSLIQQPFRGQQSVK